MNKFSLTILGAGVMVPTKEKNPAMQKFCRHDKQLVLGKDGQKLLV